MTAIYVIIVNSIFFPENAVSLAMRGIPGINSDTRKLILETARQMESETRKNNLNLIISYYDGNSDNFEIPPCIKEGIVSGIIVIRHIPRETLESIISINLPVIVIEEYFDDFNLDYVLADNIYGAYSAVDYLIKKGHTEIGFIGDINRVSSFYDRYLGYFKAMEKHKLAVNKNFILTNQTGCYSRDA